MRAAARRGDWRGSTGGHCPAYQQANLVILPKEAAAEFAAFCTRNPKPCPIIEITPPGDPEPARSAPGADLRTDLPGYRVYRRGELAEQRGDIRDLWRDDLSTRARLIGASVKGTSSMPWCVSTLGLTPCMLPIRLAPPAAPRT